MWHLHWSKWPIQEVSSCFFLSYDFNYYISFYTSFVCIFIMSFIVKLNKCFFFVFLISCTCDVSESEGSNCNYCSSLHLYAFIWKWSSYSFCVFSVLSFAVLRKSLFLQSVMCSITYLNIIKLQLVISQSVKHQYILIIISMFTNNKYVSRITSIPPALALLCYCLVYW